MTVRILFHGGDHDRTYFILIRILFHMTVRILFHGGDQPYVFYFVVWGISA